MRTSRASLVLIAGGLLTLFTSRPGFADANAVPADIQATLLAKLERYDRNFAVRAGDTARVLLVLKPGSTKSSLSVDAMKSALARVDTIGGLPHQEIVYEFKTADALATRCRTDHVAVVYLTPGLDDDLHDIRVVLSSLDLLSLAATPDYVPQGVVLGFELEAGSPKILFNLDQARQQHVDFPSDVLRLMKVYR